MGDEPPKTEPPKKMPWVVVDPMIDRTLKTLGIVTALSVLITQVIVPNLEVFGVLFQFIVLSGFVYRWRVTKNFLVGHSTQYLFSVLALVACIQVGFHISKDDAFMRGIGVAWAIIALCWASLAFIASHETDTHLRKTLNKLIDTQNQMIEYHITHFNCHETHTDGLKTVFKYINTELDQKKKNDASSIAIEANSDLPPPDVKKIS